MNTDNLSPADEALIKQAHACGDAGYVTHLTLLGVAPAAIERQFLPRYHTELEKRANRRISIAATLRTLVA